MAHHGAQSAIKSIITIIGIVVLLLFFQPTISMGINGIQAAAAKVLELITLGGSIAHSRLQQMLESNRFAHPSSYGDFAISVAGYLETLEKDIRTLHLETFGVALAPANFVKVDMVYAELTKFDLPSNDFHNLKALFLSHVEACYGKFELVMLLAQGYPNVAIMSYPMVLDDCDLFNPPVQQS